jgi:dUTPase
LDVKDGNIWKVGCIDKVYKETLKIHFLNENWKNDLIIRKDSEVLAQFG